MGPRCLPFMPRCTVAFISLCVYGCAGCCRTARTGPYSTIRVATVFEECYARSRAGGPEEMRPVGETEGQHEKWA
jgi:hypothetical protein